jgi:hypothetical protein
MVVGAHNENPGPSPENAGRAHLFDGRTGNLIHTLSSPNEEANGYFGHSVAGGGDVNGDGYDDVVVGAFSESPGSSPDFAGAAYVFNGQTGNLLHALVSPNGEVYGHFGRSVAGAGDVNGDGLGDILVGAKWESPGSSPYGAGRAYVFDGQTGDLFYTFVSPDEEAEALFGGSVSCAGDANGDGYDDVVVGAENEDIGSSPENAGRAYLFDGRTGNLIHTLSSPNEEANGYFGHSVAGCGDVNGDGYDDMVVGAFSESPGSSPDGAGRAYVFDGQTGNLLYTLCSPNEEVSGNFGVSVSGTGDIDGDGYDDVVVGANSENPGSSPERAGRAHVFSGQTGALLHTLVSPNEEHWGYFGHSVSGAGDVNDDGDPDIVVGALNEVPNGSPSWAGRTYVFSWMHLSAELTEDDLELQWSMWSPASEYWVYGVGNEPWFEPDTSPPTYMNRVGVVPAGTTTWSSTNGIGDPTNNWTYLVIAVDETELELARSNRVGEHDFDCEIP